MRGGHSTIQMRWGIGLAGLTCLAGTLLASIPEAAAQDNVITNGTAEGQMPAFVFELESLGA